MADRSQMLPNIAWQVDVLTNKKYMEVLQTLRT